MLIKCSVKYVVKSLFTFLFSYYYFYLFLEESSKHLKFCFYQTATAIKYGSLESFHKWNRYTCLKVTCWKNEAPVSCNELQFLNWPDPQGWGKSRMVYIEAHRLLPWWTFAFSNNRAFERQVEENRQIIVHLIEKEKCKNTQYDWN